MKKNPHIIIMFLTSLVFAVCNKIVFFHEIPFLIEDIDNFFLSMLLKPIFWVLWVFGFGFLPCLILVKLELSDKTSKYITCFLPGFILIFFYYGTFTESILFTENFLFSKCLLWKVIKSTFMTLVYFVYVDVLFDILLEKPILVPLLKKFNINNVTWWFFSILLSCTQSMIVVECFFKAGSY